MSKTHIKNVIRIAISDMKRQQKRRRRRTNTKNIKKATPYNNMLREMMELSARVHNVSNPQNSSNSATLLSKIDQLNNEKKLKELEYKIEDEKKKMVSNVPLLPPPQEPSFIKDLTGLEHYLSLRDVALGRTRPKDKPDELLVHTPSSSGSLFSAQSKPIIEPMSQVGTQLFSGGGGGASIASSDLPPLSDVGPLARGGGPVKWEETDFPEDLRWVFPSGKKKTDKMPKELKERRNQYKRDHPKPRS